MIDSEENWLQSWHNVIDRQGQERRAEDDRVLAEMQEKFEENKTRVCALPDDELVEHYRIYSTSSYADPRRTALIQELATVAGEEILSRMRRRFR